MFGKNEEPTRVLVDKYELFSPTDYRYFRVPLVEYLSESAYSKKKCEVELALVKTFEEYKLAPEGIGKEVEKAIKKVSSAKVYEEEAIIKHDGRALVNVIIENLDEDVKSWVAPFIHRAATTFDIWENARALMYKEAVYKVILPNMIELEKTWINLARREKNTIQIGRTHGQHAEPITFGFGIAQYVNRWGNRILKLKEATDNLEGKFSGAVGAYNALSLLVDDPIKFEEDFLKKLDLKPSLISTQIVPAEPKTDFMHCIISSFGVIANYAENIRNLQRTDIAEVSEPFRKDKQVGSSTMPHKKNPINSENVVGMWRKFIPHMITQYLNQISEHERDLRNSAPERWDPEVLVIFDSSVKRTNKFSKDLVVYRDKMKENLGITGDTILAEPLYILLSMQNYSNAHEKVRQLTMESYDTGTPLLELAYRDKNLKSYLDNFTDYQLEILSDPKKYIGIAPQKTEQVCDYWENKMNDLMKMVKT